MGKRGPHAKAPEQRLVSLTLHLPAPDFDRLSRVAIKAGVSMSAVARNLLTKSLRPTTPPPE